LNLSTVFVECWAQIRYDGLVKVHYYCAKCKKYFLDEHNIPNINKRHFCGAVASLEKIEEEQNS